MKKQFVIIWVIAIVGTIVVAVYQRVTGPTYPKKIKFVEANQEYKITLPRSANNDIDCKIEIPNLGNYAAYLHWKRYKTNDTFHISEFKKLNGSQIAYLPKQPPAGKLQYYITLKKENKETRLNPEDVIIRFKGVVPNYILVPHILFMFLSLLFSFRAGVSFFFKDDTKTNFYVILTLVTLIIGGFILGPIMQKFAFGEYWTGFPFGIDLTDNKTLIAFLIWIVVFYLSKKHVEKTKKYALIGLIVMLLMYLIPHSTLGSELDYNKLDQKKKIENTNSINK